MMTVNVREDFLDLGKSGKVLLFSDLHAHEYKPFSKPTSEGVGSRFLWVLKALDTIFQYALDNQIKHIFFLGDLFHHRTIMYSIVFEMTARKIEEAAAKDLKLHFILGNHDFIFNNDASPSLIRKIKSIDVIDTPVLFGLRNLDEKIGALRFYFNPELMIEELIELDKLAKERTKHIPNNSNCNHTLLGHFELIGATVSEEYILKEPVSPVIFDPTVFNHIFSGHIHKAQILSGASYHKQVNYIGTPIQHNFNDENNLYGFTVLDFSSGKQLRNYVPLKSLGKFPEFRTVYFNTQEEVKVFASDSSNKERFDTDYFRIQTGNAELRLDFLFKKLSNYRHEDKCIMVHPDSTNNETNNELKFNLDMSKYFELFMQEQRTSEDMDWVDKEKLNEFLDKVRVKGNIVQ